MAKNPHAFDVVSGAVITDHELKFDVTKTGAFEGYASVFGNVDSHGDIVAPGAYGESLAKSNAVPMLFNHWMDNLIGKAVDLKEDDIGLKFTGRFTPGASMANDVYAHMKAGNLDGVSIGMRIQPGGADVEGRVRTIKRATPLEISMVIAPANVLARADLSSLKFASDFDPDEFKSLADIETFLRDAGMSRLEAKAMVARVRSIALRDAGQGNAPDDNDDEASAKAAADVIALINSHRS